MIETYELLIDTLKAYRNRFDGGADAVIAVGWDSVMNYQRDKDFLNHRLSVRGEMLIGCNALPKNEWDVDEPGNPWASFILMDNGCYILPVS